MTALPVLYDPPAVSRSSDRRYLVIKWPEWVANVTGNGTGPVVGYILQGMAQPDGAEWHNLVTMEQQLSTESPPATATRWFTHVAEGKLVTPLIIIIIIIINIFNVA